MKTKLLTLALALVATTAFGNDIYKYVDENGTVHYVDRPTGAESEERVAYVSQRGTTSAPRGEDSGPDWRERRQARQEAEQEEADNAAEAAAQAKACEEYRARLESYNTARRLYRNNEQGEREYLDEAEVAEARQKVAELIEQNCM